MSKHDKAPNYLLRRGVAIALGTVALVGGTVAVNKANSDNIKVNFLKNEVDGISRIETARNAITVLSEGVTYRSAPKISNGEDGIPNTIAGKIPKGSAVVIKFAPQQQDSEGDNWIAFHFNKGEDSINSADPKDLYWANLTKLNQESNNGQSLITEFRYPDVGSKASPTDIPISVDSNQRFSASGKDGGPEIGVADIMTNQQVTDLLNKEQAVIIG